MPHGHPLYMSLLTEVYFFSLPGKQSSKVTFLKRGGHRETPLWFSSLNAIFHDQKGELLVDHICTNKIPRPFACLSSTFVSSSSHLHFKGKKRKLNSNNSLQNTALWRSSFDPSDVRAAFERHQRKSLNLSVFLSDLTYFPCQLKLRS